MTTNAGTGSEDLRALVQRVVREELAQARLATLGQDAGQVIAQVGPIIEQSILDALALGAQLAAGEAPALRSPGPGDTTAAVGPAPAVAYTPPAVTLGEPAQQAARTPAAAALDGSVTLVVSPFAGYTAVQRFLKDLERSPLVHDVRPKRFAAGRLFVLVQTESNDNRALAEGLVQELAGSGLVVRSVQQDLVELVIEGAA